MKTVEEFRGTDKLVYAEVLHDDNTNGYVTGNVKELAPVAEISKTTETSSEAKYYDNKPALVINAEGADTITLAVSALDLATLADITGKATDPATGAFLDGNRVPRYFAVGYRLRLTDGTYRYVWRYKGTFAVPDETSQTENNGTDSNNQTLTYTGIETTHVFTKATDAQGYPTSQKALVVDERDGKAELSTFFDTVTTCDTLQPAAGYFTITNVLNHVSNSSTVKSVAANAAYNATLTAGVGYTIGAVTVTMGGTNVTSTVYSSGTITIAAVTGNVVIVAEGTAQA